MTYEPGALMMVDFAGDKISYIDRPTGALVECPVFVCILPYSGYSYVIAVRDEKTPNVIKALNASVAFFEGVPLGAKSDNMRTAVVKSCNYEPVFTEVFEQWALHNNIALFAARPYKPKDKAMVEKEVLLTYQRLYAPLRDREFFSLEQINAAFQEQLVLHHQMHFQKKTISRLEQFLELVSPFGNEQILLLRRVALIPWNNRHLCCGINGTYLMERWHLSCGIFGNISGGTW